MESRPDSAMMILNSIDRSKLKDSEFPFFALLYTQAQIKTYVPLDSDSLICLAYAKYGNCSKRDLGLRANFYFGEVFFNQNNLNKAMRYYITVYEESKRLDNDYWRAKAADRISDLFYCVYNYDEAEKYGTEAAYLFKLVNRKTFHRYTLGKLANIYIYNGDAAKAYGLLDSLKRLTLSETPIDSAYLNFINLPLIDASFRCDSVNDDDIENINFILDNVDIDDAIDAAILKSQVLNNLDEDKKATSILNNIQTLASSDEEKVHILYARYMNAKSIGNPNLALSIVDSVLLLQNKIAENIIQESVVGAQRDFYEERGVLQKQRSSFFKTMLIVSCLVFLLLLVFVIALVYYRNKAIKTRLKEHMEMLISLRAYSEKIMRERNALKSSLDDKEVIIDDLTGIIDESLNRVNILNKCISEKDVAVGQLKALLDDKEHEFISIQALLEKKNAEFNNIQILLNEKSEKEITQAQIVERLFKEKWTTMDLLCNQYFSLTNFELSERGILSNMEKEVKRIVSKKGLSEIVDSVDEYMGSIISSLRKQCPILKEDDICFIALSYAGFSARSVCLFTNMKYKHYYVKKARLIERIQKSEATDKELFISKMR